MERKEIGFMRVSNRMFSIHDVCYLNYDKKKFQALQSEKQK